MNDVGDIESIYFCSLNCNGFDQGQWFSKHFFIINFKGDDRQKKMLAQDFYCYNDPLFPPKKTA